MAQLRPDEVLALKQAEQLDVESRDEELGDHPYSPVYDEHGELWVGSPIA